MSKKREQQRMRRMSDVQTELDKVKIQLEREKRKNKLLKVKIQEFEQERDKMDREKKNLSKMRREIMGQKRKNEELKAENEKQEKRLQALRKNRGTRLHSTGSIPSAQAVQDNERLERQIGKLKEELLEVTEQLSKQTRNQSPKGHYNQSPKAVDTRHVDRKLGLVKLACIKALDFNEKAHTEMFNEILASGGYEEEFKESVDSAEQTTIRNVLGRNLMDLVDNDHEQTPAVDWDELQYDPRTEPKLIEKELEECKERIRELEDVLIPKAEAKSRAARKQSRRLPPGRRSRNDKRSNSTSGVELRALRELQEKKTEIEKLKESNEDCLTLYRLMTKDMRRRLDKYQEARDLTKRNFISFLDHTYKQKEQALKKVVELEEENVQVGHKLVLFRQKSEELEEQVGQLEREKAELQEHLHEVARESGGDGFLELKARVASLETQNAALENSLASRRKESRDGWKQKWTQQDVSWGDPPDRTRGDRRDSVPPRRDSEPEMLPVNFSLLACQATCVMNLLDLTARITGCTRYDESDSEEEKEESPEPDPLPVVHSRSRRARTASAGVPKAGASLRRSRQGSPPRGTSGIAGGRSRSHSSLEGESTAAVTNQVLADGRRRTRSVSAIAAAPPTLEDANRAIAPSPPRNRNRPRGNSGRLGGRAGIQHSSSTPLQGQRSPTEGISSPNFQALTKALDKALHTKGGKKGNQELLKRFSTMEEKYHSILQERDSLLKKNHALEKGLRKAHSQITIKAKESEKLAKAAGRESNQWKEFATRAQTENAELQKQIKEQREKLELMSPKKFEAVEQYTELVKELERCQEVLEKNKARTNELEKIRGDLEIQLEQEKAKSLEQLDQKEATKEQEKRTLGNRISYWEKKFEGLMISLNNAQIETEIAKSESEMLKGLLENRKKEEEEPNRNPKRRDRREAQQSQVQKSQSASASRTTRRRRSNSVGSNPLAAYTGRGRGSQGRRSETESVALPLAQIMAKTDKKEQEFKKLYQSYQVILKERDDAMELAEKLQQRVDSELANEEQSQQEQSDMSERDDEEEDLDDEEVAARKRKLSMHRRNSSSTTLTAKIDVLEMELRHKSKIITHLEREVGRLGSLSATPNRPLKKWEQTRNQIFGYSNNDEDDNEPSSDSDSDEAQPVAQIKMNAQGGIEEVSNPYSAQDSEDDDEPSASEDEDAGPTPGGSGAARDPTAPAMAPRIQPPRQAAVSGPRDPTAPVLVGGLGGAAGGAKVDELRETIRKLELEIEQKDQMIEGLRGDLAGIRTDFTKLREDLANSRADLASSRSAHKTILDAAKRDLEEANVTKSEIRGVIQSLKDVAEGAGNVMQLRHRLREAIEANRANVQKIQRYQAQVNHLYERNQGQEQQIQHLSKQLQDNSHNSRGNQELRDRNSSLEERLRRYAGLIIRLQRELKRKMSNQPNLPKNRQSRSRSLEMALAEPLDEHHKENAGRGAYDSRGSRDRDSKLGVHRRRGDTEPHRGDVRVTPSGRQLSPGPGPPAGRHRSRVSSPPNIPYKNPDAPNGFMLSDDQQPPSPNDSVTRRSVNETVSVADSSPSLKAVNVRYESPPRERGSPTGSFSVIKLPNEQDGSRHRGDSMRSGSPGVALTDQSSAASGLDIGGYMSDEGESIKLSEVM